MNKGGDKEMKAAEPKVRGVAARNITLRNLDEHLCMAIKREALEHKMSITTYIVNILKDRKIITDRWGKK